jgi:hypothetical protein
MRFSPFLFLAISLTWLTTTPVQADWPNWGCIPLTRWTGYGFGDGYHHRNCSQAKCCGQGVGGYSSQWWISQPVGNCAAREPTTQVAQRPRARVTPPRRRPASTVKKRVEPHSDPMWLLTRQRTPLK